MAKRDLLTAAELTDAFDVLQEDWSANEKSLTRTVEFASFLTAVAFIDALAPVAERLDHHPDLSLSWRTVKLTLTTHSAGGVSALDLQLAAELDAIIDRL